MKIKINHIISMNFHKIIFLIFIIQFFSFTIQNEVSFTNSENSLLTTDLENDLFKLLNKIRQKKIDTQNSKNSNLLSVSINNFFDLRNYLQNIKDMKNNLLTEKNKEWTELNNLSQKVLDHITKNQNNLNKLKSTYDEIIQKINNVSKDTNKKLSELTIAKSDFESTKNDYEKFNEIFSEKVKKNFDLTDQHPNINSNSDLKLEDKISQKFLKLNNKISGLNKSLTERNNLQDKILKIEENSKKSEIELKNLKKISDENKMDQKLFHLIEGNLSNNIKQMRSEEFNSTVVISSLNKLANDKENFKKLESEKFQLKDMSKESYKSLKSLQVEHKAIQFEVKNLMSKKNKLKEQMSAKEIEENLKLNKIKTDITEVKKEIKSTENKLSENLKNQKNVKYFFNLRIVSFE